MKAKKILPPVEFLRECFIFEQETGSLIWKSRPREHFTTDGFWKRFNRHKTGKKAGVISWRDMSHTNPAGVLIKVRYQRKALMIYAHLIIFAMMGVDVPEGMHIDHINGSPTDNRWDNLRIATPSQNSCNKKKNRTGRGCDLQKGVTRYRGAFRAVIMKDGKTTLCGIFSTPEKAHFAYCEKARELHGEFFRCG